MTKGKNFSCNNLGQRKKSDFYETPYSLVWQLMQTQCFGSYWYTHPILEPACGDGAIVKALIDCDKRCEEMITATDITKGDNFLDRDEKEIVKYPNVPELDSDKWPLIITNPPFSLADEFIKKAKKNLK